MRCRSASSRLGDGRFELEHASLDLQFLDANLLLALDLVNLDLLGDDLLLRLVRGDVVRLLGGGSLRAHGDLVLGLFHLEVASGFRLSGLRGRLRDHTLLISLRLGDGRFAHRHRAADGRVTLGFGLGDVRLALDARNVWTAHVVDVVVFVDDLFDGEGHYLEAHLGQVVGDAVSHAAGDDLRLLDDLFDLQQADDAAQVTFHDQPQQCFAFLGWLGQKLL